MRYVTSRYVLAYQEEAYRIYVTDAIKAFGKFNHRWYDMVHPKKEVDPADEEQKAKEIISDISARLNAIGGGDGLNDVSGEVDT